MAVIADLNVKIGAQIKDLERDLKKGKREISQFADEIQDIGSRLSLALTLPILGGGAAAVRTAAQYEQLEAAFSVMLGSADRAKELFAGLKQDAATTPFELTELAEATKRLLAFGISSDDVRGELKMLGDIAAGTGANVGELARIFGQSKAVGTVLTADLRELANRGIPIFDALKERFGLTGEELRKFVEGGNVNFEILRETLADMTKEGGMFFQGMEKQSQTMSGLFSTLKDNVTESLATLGATIATTFDLKGNIKSATEAIGGLISWFQQLDGATQKAIVKVGLLVAAIGPAVNVMGYLFASGMRLKLMYKNVTDAIGIAREAMQFWRLQVAAGEIATSRLGIAINGAKTAWKNFDMATKATTIGLIAAGIGLAVIAFQRWNEQMSTAAKVQRNLSEANIEAEKNIVAERLEAERLTNVLKDENAKREDKVNALNRLNEISPEYFGGLKLEKSSVNDINSAYESYVANLLKVAKARAVSEKLVEIAKKRIELQNEIEKTGQIGIVDALIFGTSGGQMGGMAKLGALSKQIKELEEQEKALAKQAAENPVNISVNSTATTDIKTPSVTPKTDKAATENLKNTATVLADLEKSYLAIERRSEAFGTAFDANAEKVKVLRTAIESMLEMGVKPSDPLLASMIDRFKVLGGELDLLPQRFSVVTEPMLATTTQMAMQADIVSSAFQGLGQTLSDAAVGAGQAMMQMAMQGESSFKKLGKAALAAAASVVRAALIKIVSEVAADAFKKFGVFGAIAAPALAAGAGALFNKLITSLKIPALAQGGITMGPTWAMVGDNPSGKEAIIPLEKFDSVFGGGGQNIHLTGDVRWNGREFVIGFEQAQRDMGRVRGR